MALLLAVWAVPAAAQEFVEVPGRLDDEAFYRAVACGASPGGPCTKPFIRWPRTRRDGVTVALASFPADLAPRRRAVFETALTEAMSEVNRLGANIRLAPRRAGADIDVHVVRTPPGHVMRDTGVPALDGHVLALGRVALRARAGEIRDGLIAVSAFAGREELTSVLLEEITQALGLMTDIRGPAYRGSLFAEDGNTATRLEGQDAMAVRRHYARSPDGDS
jgi:hypothetical protein